MRSAIWVAVGMLVLAGPASAQYMDTASLIGLAMRKRQVEAAEAQAYALQQAQALEAQRLASDLQTAALQREALRRELERQDADRREIERKRAENERLAASLQPAAPVAAPVAGKAKAKKVYVMRSDKLFHRAGCELLEPDAPAISLKVAAAHRKPCEVCF